MRHILKLCGWLKKHKNHYGLTAKGRRILTHGFSASEFFTLFKVFTRKFNWAFQDRYPELQIIQDGYLFCLYLVYRKARDFVEDQELGEFFVRAFPMAVSEMKAALPINPADNVKSCFSLRFLDRFCEYFGLVDTRREKLKPYGYRLFVKKSDFFDNYLVWKGV